MGGASNIYTLVGTSVDVMIYILGGVSGRG